MATKKLSAVAPAEFIDGRLDGMEAVVVRIGAHEALLVLIDAEGRWDHWVYQEVNEAKTTAEALGITSIHIGEYPEKTRVRMNSYRPPASDFDGSAYPEEGEVGPIIPYPENRPRPPGVLPEEEAPRRTASS